MTLSVIEGLKVQVVSDITYKHVPASINWYNFLTLHQRDKNDYKIFRILAILMLQNNFIVLYFSIALFAWYRDCVISFYHLHIIKHYKCDNIWYEYKIWIWIWI